MCQTTQRGRRNRTTVASSRMDSMQHSYVPNCFNLLVYLFSLFMLSIYRKTMSFTQERQRLTICGQSTLRDPFT